jgi:lysophospholipase L1-like esterase
MSTVLSVFHPEGWPVNLLLISVGLNLLIVGFGIWVWWRGAGQLSLAKHIGLAHERCVTQFEKLPIKQGDIVFLGDSITEGGAWQEMFPNASVRNRGIGGDTSDGVLTRVHQISSGKPAQVFLMIGSNDLDVADRSESEIVANIVEIVEKLKSASPKPMVYVQSVLPREKDFRVRVESLNIAIKTAIAGNAVWINLHQLFLDKSDGAILNEFSNDKLHLTGEGYMVWREAIMGSIAGHP